MELSVTGSIPPLVPVLVVVLGLLFSAGCLKLGARLAGARAGWGRAGLAVLILYPTGLFVSLLASLVLGPGLGFVLGLLAVLAVLKTLLGASWLQALVMWLLMMVAQVAAMILAAGLLGWGLMELFRHLEPMLPGREYEVGLPLHLGQTWPGPLPWAC